MTTNIKDMTSGSPAKHILVFALPIMIGNILQQMYTIVDTIVVGRVIGVKALAAVGSADWLNWLVLGTIIGFCHGFSIMIAQRFGAADYVEMRKAVAMSILLSAFVAILFTILFLPLARILLVILNTPTDIIEDSLKFLNIMFSGIVVITGYNILSSILRALGNSKTPLVAMGIASVINIILDFIFVLLFRWGVSGAAAATVSAQLFSCLYCMKALNNIDLLKTSRKDWIPDKKIILELIKIGTPMAFQNAIIGIGGVVVQSVINGFGVIFVAGFTAAMKLYGLLELAATSFGFAVASFTGQNHGSKKFERIRTGINSALKMSISVALVISTITLLLGRQIVRLFVSGSPSDVKTVVDIAYNYLAIMSILLFVLYMLYIYRSALQGMGDTLIPMISGFVELLMRVGIVLLLPLLLGRNGVYFAEVIAWVGAEIILMITYYYRMNNLNES